MHKASCLCGAIRIEVTGDLPEADACHCTQCRKQSGHYWSSIDVPTSAVTISDEDHVRWYQSSGKVRRGFCDTCGSFLFWDPIHHDKLAIAMGCFDQPTNTKIWRHIFVADKGDYYEIEAGVLQRDQQTFSREGEGYEALFAKRIRPSWMRAFCLLRRGAPSPS